MNRNMFLTVGAVIATLACAATSVSAAHAATPRSAGKQRPSQAVAARELAAGVTRAVSECDRGQI